MSSVYLSFPPPPPPPHSAEKKVASSHWTCLGTQLYTSLIALTRGIYLLWHYIRERERDIQGAYKLIFGHRTVIWLWNEISKEAVCLRRRGTHAERCLVAN